LSKRKIKQITACVTPTTVEVEAILKRKTNVSNAIQPYRILFVGTVNEPLTILVFFVCLKCKVILLLFKH